MRGTIPERHQLSEVLLELQKMKTRFANLARNGEIVDVKYDQDLKRWYAKYREESHDPDKPFISDWRPWKTFAHGSISVSMPPKIGMKATLCSPGGYPEQGYIEPYHNGPDTPSASDQPDQMVTKVQKQAEKGQDADKDQTLTLTWTKDGATHAIGDTTHAITKDSQSIKTKTDSIDTETHVAKASKSHTVQTKSRTVTAETTTITSGTYSLTGKTLINC